MTHQRLLSLLLLLAVGVSSAAQARVTIRSAADPSLVDVSPERSFPCETLDWVDPDDPIGNPSLGALTCYRVDGVVGAITLRRSGPASLEVLGTELGGSPPLPGGDLDEAATWGNVRFQSGTAIGRCLTPELGGGVTLRDRTGSMSQYFAWDSATLELRDEAGECLEADADSTRVAACSGGPGQRWVLDAVGRLRADTCVGEWACLVTPDLGDGVSPVLRSCDPSGPLPAETWAIAHWSEPVDRAAIFAGLTDVVSPSNAWPVAAIEGSAEPVLVGADGRAFAVAGTAGTGRALAIGDWRGVCQDGTDPTWEAFLSNALSWAGRSSDPLLGLAPESINQEGCLQALGFRTTRVTFDDLTGIDVLVLRSGVDGAAAADIARIEQHLRAGGGVFAARHVFFYWDVAEYPPADNLTAAVMSLAGIAWTQDLDEAVDFDEVIDVTRAHDPRVERLTDAFETFARNELGIETVPAPELAQLDALTRVNATSRCRFSPVSPFTVAQRALRRLHGPLLIGPGQPFRWGDDPVGDMTVRGDYVLTSALPSDRTPAHESAELYPGLVDASVPRITRTVTIDGTVPDRREERWRSTNLYAPPGEEILVRADPRVFGQRLFVQVGASFDDPMPVVGWLQPNEFERFPWITVGRLLQAPEIRLASAFGGPIYVTIPSGTNLGPFDIEIEGAVELTPFVLGETDEAEWRAGLGDAPLGELVSDEVILTARSSSLANIPDPETLLTAFRDLVLAEGALVGVDGDDAGGESLAQRIVFDPFEEWGAHSGYPVHMTASWEESLFDMSLWPGGSGLWAFTHEVGHNHQRGDWTLDDWGEVTCNVIGVNAQDELGLPRDQMWGGNLEPALMEQRTQDWLDSGAPYQDQGYFVALYFHLYVVDEFGWSSLADMYADYRGLPAAERPANEQEKIDQLCVRMSNAVGHDLVPWFETFRFPLSPDVPPQTAGLPEWLDPPF